MDLTSDDIHNISFDSKHLPNPTVRVSDRRSIMFHLPLGFRIVYVSNFVNCSSINLLVFFQLSQAL
jgi:hypothetical protein